MKQLRFIFGTVVVLAVGCNKQVATDDADWSKTQEIGKSADSLSTSFTPYKWNGALLALGGEAGTFAMRFLTEDGAGWRTVPIADPGWVPLDSDPKVNRLVVTRGTIQGDKIELTFIIASLTQDGSFSKKSSRPLILDKSDIFGASTGNVHLSLADRPVTVLFAGGAMGPTQIHIPYCIRGRTMTGNTISSSAGRYNNDVFYTTDAGQSWKVDRISDSYSILPTVCQTVNYYYFVAGKPLENELWYSRKSVEGGGWSSPDSINQTFPSAKGDFTYRAVADGDTMHLCWLDRRNEKERLNPAYPNRQNYEVAYCYRKDSDSSWSKDIILSEGLLYAYAPSISVDGHNVVVAWAGVQHDKDGRNEFDPSDIYYATSKDGGKTWTKPMQVTNGFKSGLTSGRPQVALHEDVIHLFYVQGKLNYKKVSPGMVKLNQPPWPIYYRQRPFPN